MFQSHLCSGLFAILVFELSAEIDELPRFKWEDCHYSSQSSLLAAEYGIVE